MVSLLQYCLLGCKLSCTSGIVHSGKCGWWRCVGNGGPVFKGGSVNGVLWSSEVVKLFVMGQMVVVDGLGLWGVEISSNSRDMYSFCVWGEGGFVMGGVAGARLLLVVSRVVKVWLLWVWSRGQEGLRLGSGCGGMSAVAVCTCYRWWCSYKPCFYP